MGIFGQYFRPDRPISLSIKGSPNQSHTIFDGKVGSDIERLWIWLTSSSIDFESIKKFNFRVVLCRIRRFPTLVGKIKWLEHGLPFKNDSSWEETLKFTHCDGRSTLLCNVYNFYEWLRFYVSFELHYYINIRYIYYMFYYLKKTE